ncbi:MAG TPA: hypothetical protein VK802_01160 [Streptosporangiaceae bacterium]|jgi:hypothetical protein|nr:hypothetical protein [Streptosporangiaceae bacterium]
MGMFKSMRDLQKQAKEIEKTMPPVGDRMRAAQERMAGASQMMAAQTQAATAAAAAVAGLANGTSVRRTVMISGMRQVGVINFDLLVEFELTVMADGMPPYPATTQQAISQMQIGQLRTGMTLQGAVDPANPTAVWLDLTSIK